MYVPNTKKLEWEARHPDYLKHGNMVYNTVNRVRLHNPEVTTNVNIPYTHLPQPM